jgi:uncharacterized protein YcfL
MSTRALLRAGMMGAALLVVGCSKSEPEQATPEQAAGAAADTTTAAAGAAADTSAASTGAVQDSAAAQVPDTTGLGAGADSVQPDSM